MPGFDIRPDDQCPGDKCPDGSSPVKNVRRTFVIRTPSGIINVAKAAIFILILSIFIRRNFKPMEARLREGFGPLDFGCDQSDCQKHFGEPDEKENLEGVDGSSSAVWHYWEKGFSLFFDNDFGSKFCCVEIDQSFPLKVYGQLIFGKREQEVIELMKNKGFKVTDTEQHEWGERRITFDDIFADFYFEKGKLISINYSVPLGELQERTNFN